MTRRSIYLTIIFSVCLALFIHPASAQAVMADPPSSFYGSVTIGGSPAPDGTSVDASCGNVSAGTSTSGGNYSLKVPAGDPSCTNGDTVTFKVNGKKAGSSSFESGANKEVNLSVEATPVPPPPTRVPKTATPKPPHNPDTATPTVYYVILPTRTATPTASPTPLPPTLTKRPTKTPTLTLVPTDTPTERPTLTPVPLISPTVSESTSESQSTAQPGIETPKNIVWIILFAVLILIAVIGIMVIIFYR